MEEKKDLKGVLLVVFIIISLLLGGFVVYDKLLKKDTDGCEKPVCQCDNEKKMTFASKYANEQDEESYLTFDTTNSTFSGFRNACEGYEDVSGTYVIENNIITLNNDIFKSYDSTVRFELITDSSNKVIKLRDLTGGLSTEEMSFHYSGCSPTDYYVAK